MSRCGNQQVQPAIAVDVREHGSAADARDGAQTSFESQVLKSPRTEIPVERVPTIQAAQEYIRSAVSIEVADSHSAAVFQDTVGAAGPLVEQVREVDSGPRRRQQCKSGFPLFRKL